MSGTVTEIGGTVNAGESFNLSYPAGGLTGLTSVTINGVACTGVTIVDDFNLNATAPVDGLLHGTSYTLSIN